MRDIRRTGMCAGGKEAATPEELARVSVTPQGIEWLLSERTSLEEIEGVFGQLPQGEWGYYVHRGEVEVDEMAKVQGNGGEYRVCVLVGDTHGLVTLKGATLSHIVLLYGASAEVDASEYAVVKIYGEGMCVVRTDKTAIEL